MRQRSGHCLDLQARSPEISLRKISESKRESSILQPNRRHGVLPSQHEYTEGRLPGKMLCRFRPAWRQRCCRKGSRLWIGQGTSRRRTRHCKGVLKSSFLCQRRRRARSMPTEMQRSGRVRAMSSALTIISILTGIAVSALFWNRPLAIKLKTLGLALLFSASLIVVRLSFGYHEGIWKALTDPPMWKLASLISASIGLMISIIWSLAESKSPSK